MIHQAYIEILQTARIKEREKVARRSIQKKILERKGDKQKTLAIEYRENDEKQENLDSTQSRKKKDLD